MKKISWGWGIIASFVVFMSGTAAWVAYAMTSEVDLVRSDYYEYSLKQDETATAQENARLLGTYLVLDTKRPDNNILLQIPAEQATNASGTVKLYRPNSPASDRSLPLKVSENGAMTIPTATLAKGVWKITIDWSASGKSYEVLKTDTL